MNKIIISSIMTISFMTNLHAFKVCDKDLLIGDTLSLSKTEKREWTERPAIEVNTELKVYEKHDGKKTCKVYTTKEKEIVRIIKKLDSFLPVVPPKQVMSAKFKRASLVYFDKSEGKLNTYKFTSAKDLLDIYPIAKKGLRLAKIQYSNPTGNYTANIISMCKLYGSKCSFIFEMNKKSFFKPSGIFKR